MTLWQWCWFAGIALVVIWVGAIIAVIQPVDPLDDPLAELTDKCRCWRRDYSLLNGGDGELHWEGPCPKCSAWDRRQQREREWKRKHGQQE